MGHRYGTILYRQGFRVPEQSTEKLDFGRRSEGEVGRIFPEVLDEIRGFAEACHTSYEQLAALMMGIGAFKPGRECSIFASAGGGNVIFGRNYDFFYSFKKHTESCLTSPQSGHKSLGHSDVFIGREDGVNENGLAIGMTGVSGKTVKPGISFCLVLRAVLDKCANAEEAVRLLVDAHIASAANFLLADKSGVMAIVEASPDITRVRRPVSDEHFIVCTNHFVHPEMQEMEDLEDRAKSQWDTIPRYTTISKTLRERNSRLSIRGAQKILAAHDGYVCSHQENIKLGTLWSIVASLKEPRVFRAEGQVLVTSGVGRAVLDRW